MKKILLLFCASAFHFQSMAQQPKAERSGEPDIYYAKSDDKEMNAAIEKAQKTFSDFAKAMNDPKNTNIFFGVKLPFETVDQNVEHIWVSDVKNKEGKYFGRVDNTPDNVMSVKLGDIIEIDPKKISDWMYVKDGKLVGGHTIRVLRNRMTPDERRKFDTEFGVQID